MRALVVQPPFVQLNAPYPAVWYLDARLRALGHASEARDHSIAAWRSLYSRSGLAQAFDEAERRFDPASTPDKTSREQVLRYLSNRDAYLALADGLVAYLSGHDPSFAHRLAATRDLPYGARAEAMLEEKDGVLLAEDAPRFATAIVNDLGDFLRFAVDPDFDAIRYGERLGRSGGSFAALSQAADSGWVLRSIYAPILEAEFSGRSQNERLLLLLSIPFPGCAAGALACARAARRILGDSVRIVLGGGYVSTELRGLASATIFDDVDYLAFDAGYGALDSILELESGASPDLLYRTMRRGADGRVEACGFPEADDAAAPKSGRVTKVLPAEDFQNRERAEALALTKTFPDYQGARFGDYVGAVDSANPMHRLWSDAPWLKYHLAYGCYWARCAFCDTELDYVARYRPSDTRALLDAALAARAGTGIGGIHFTDEAMPIPQLLRFAQANAELARPFHYWGNIRFDKGWTDGLVALLAARGLTAVSGGIEIATAKGLELTGKGIEFDDIVRALLAFRRNGVLTHAYLIYGFPGQDEQDIIDSAEAVRQLFAAGLLDSAFWHRFALTRHSRMYAEWKQGLHPKLAPREPGASAADFTSTADFAANDLDFAGEERFEAWGSGLDAALSAWMAGQGLDEPISDWFKGMRVPRTRLAEDFVERAGLKAEAALEAEPLPQRARGYWIAGLPRLEPVDAKGRSACVWAFRGKLERLKASPPEAASLAERILALARNPAGSDWATLVADGASGARLASLRGRGLVAVRS